MGPAPPPYKLRSGSLSHGLPRLLLLLFPSMTPPPCYVSPSPFRGAMGPSLLLVLRHSHLLGHLLPLLLAPLSHRLLPSIASLRPSTVCPSPWAGYRPRLLLGRSAMSGTLMFFYGRVAFSQG